MARSIDWILRTNAAAAVGVCRCGREIISISGWETRLKSSRCVEGGWRVVFAVSCSSWICFMPICRGVTRHGWSEDVSCSVPSTAKGR